jgi:hypothetical protein
MIAIAAVAKTATSGRKRVNTGYIEVPRKRERGCQRVRPGRPPSRCFGRRAEALGNSQCSVNIDAHAFDPDESADDFDERLNDKVTKTYAQGRTIWLALILNDRMQVPSLSMEAIRARLPANIGQFSRLLFGSLEDAEMIVRP